MEYMIINENTYMSIKIKRESKYRVNMNVKVLDLTCLSYLMDQFWVGKCGAVA